MLYRCKNKSCRRRRKLNKPIEQYVRKPTCFECGSDLAFDKWQTKKNKENTCKCSGVPYPHRKGSVIGCEYYDKEVSEEEYHDWIHQMTVNSRQEIRI